jgi:hydrogenase maturation factor
MFPLGKISPEILERTVFRWLGSERNDVILGPSRGEDAAIIQIGDYLVALKCDPISGAVDRIGWLAVNIASNDIATMGVKPNWILSCIMLPIGSGEEVLEDICRKMDEAAKKLGISIVGGHSEITPGLDHPLVITFSAGVVEGDHFVKSGGAESGARIILTKGTGIEGTAILASDRSKILEAKYGKPFVSRAKEYFDKISVVKEALLAFDFGGVSAMHDPTEGGVAGGLHELCDAASKGFKIYEEKILVGKETLEICRLFGIDHLNLISSGSLLITAESEKANGIIKILQSNGIEAAIIGEIVEDENKRVVIKDDGSEKKLLRPLSDDLWSALAKKFK